MKLMKARYQQRNLFFALIAISVGMAFPVLAAARSHYVELWGEDNFRCTKPQPCLTIQHAVDLARNNDRIIVGPGNYEENLLLYIPGLKVESTAGRHATTIDAESADMNVVTIVAPKVAFGKKAKGFTLIGATAVAWSGIEVNVPDDNPNIRIEGNRIGLPRDDRTDANTGHENHSGIRVISGGEKIQIRYNVVQNNGIANGTDNFPGVRSFGGIICAGCTRGLISDNRMEGNAGVGLAIQGPSDRVVVKRNVIVKNTSHVVYSNNLGVININNNLIELNGQSGDNGAGVLIESGNGGKLDRNIVAGNGYHGLHVFQDEDPVKTFTVSGNLSLRNIFDGINLVDAEGARVDSNSTVGNTNDGIEAFLTSDLRSLARNNAYAHSDCGLEGDVGETFQVSRNFLTANDEDACDATFEVKGGSHSSKPNRLKINPTRGLLGG